MTDENALAGLTGEPEISALIAAAFANPESGRAWLTTKNAMLDGARPLDMLSSTDGKTMVLNLLLRIEYGIFS